MRLPFVFNRNQAFRRVGRPIFELYIQSMKWLALLLVITSLSNRAIAQESEFAELQKNTVRLNVTPLFVSSPTSFVLGYERLLSESQSVSLNVGRVEFPISINVNVGKAKLISATQNDGFTATFDYRFYVQSRNTKPAPDGLYWAPFATYYNFSLGHEIEINDGNNTDQVNLSTGINAFAVGVELGYQFTFGKHWSVDLILIGPAYGYYEVSNEIDGAIPNNYTQNEVWEASRDLLFGAFPGFVSLVESGEFSNDGSSTMYGMNFRYVLQIGYRF